MIETYSDIRQDVFAITMLDFKHNGTYVDIGANAPTWSSNTYLLEKEYGFTGISIDKVLFDDYKTERPKSNYVIANALEIDYTKLFQEYSMPRQIDYLSIDIDPCKQSLAALKKLPTDYRFSVITFEYELPWDSVKDESREYLKNLGYHLAFADMPRNIKDPFEDWYIDPTVIDIKQIEKFQGVVQ